MYRYIETIRIVDGEVMSLTYHQHRVDSTLRNEGWIRVPLQLKAVLTDAPQGEGVTKARIVYDAEGRVVEKSYNPYHIRKIDALQLVEDDGIEYGYKFEDRSRLADLAALRGKADEIIIVKQGRLTDTSYSNIALFDGKQWFTPLYPLLPGTMRQRLIDEGELLEADIKISELEQYSQVCLINAMMPLGRCVVEMRNVFSLFTTASVIRNKKLNGIIF